MVFTDVNREMEVIGNCLILGRCGGYFLSKINNCNPMCNSCFVNDSSDHIALFCSKYICMERDTLINCFVDFNLCMSVNSVLRVSGQTRSTLISVVYFLAKSLINFGFNSIL